MLGTKCLGHKITAATVDIKQFLMHLAIHCTNRHFNKFLKLKINNSATVNTCSCGCSSYTCIMDKLVYKFMMCHYTSINMQSHFSCSYLNLLEYMPEGCYKNISVSSSSRYWTLLAYNEVSWLWPLWCNMMNYLLEPLHTLWSHWWCGHTDNLYCHFNNYVSFEP